MKNVKILVGIIGGLSVCGIAGGTVAVALTKPVYIEEPSVVVKNNNTAYLIWSNSGESQTQDCSIGYGPSSAVSEGDKMYLEVENNKNLNVENFQFICTDNSSFNSVYKDGAWDGKWGVVKEDDKYRVYYNGTPDTTFSKANKDLLIFVLYDLGNGEYTNINYYSKCSFKLVFTPPPAYVTQTSSIGNRYDANLAVISSGTKYTSSFLLTPKSYDDYDNELSGFSYNSEVVTQNPFDTDSSNDLTIIEPDDFKVYNQGIATSIQPYLMDKYGVDFLQVADSETNGHMHWELTSTSTTDSSIFSIDSLTGIISINVLGQAAGTSYSATTKCTWFKTPTDSYSKTDSFHFTVVGGNANSGYTIKTVSSVSNNHQYGMIRSFVFDDYGQEIKDDVNSRYSISLDGFSSDMSYSLDKTTGTFYYYSSGETSGSVTFNYSNLSFSCSTTTDLTISGNIDSSSVYNFVDSNFIVNLGNQIEYNGEGYSTMPTYVTALSIYSISISGFDKYKSFLGFPLKFL